MRLILIVTDVGGPVALHDILSELPPDFGTPIVVVQPGGEGLLESAIAALRHTTALRIAKMGQVEDLQAGVVYFAEMTKGYLPGADRDKLVLEYSAAASGRGSISATLGALARLLGSELTAVFLSGRGDATEIMRVCSVLEQCGCRMLVLDRKESVVGELGQCALRSAASAHELSASGIVAVICGAEVESRAVRNTTQNASN